MSVLDNSPIETPIGPWDPPKALRLALITALEHQAVRGTEPRFFWRLLGIGVSRRRRWGLYAERPGDQPDCRIVTRLLPDNIRAIQEYFGKHGVTIANFELFAHHLGAVEAEDSAATVSEYSAQDSAEDSAPTVFEYSNSRAVVVRDANARRWIGADCWTAEIAEARPFDHPASARLYLADHPELTLDVTHVLEPAPTEHQEVA